MTIENEEYDAAFDEFASKKASASEESEVMDDVEDSQPEPEGDKPVLEESADDAETGDETPSDPVAEEIERLRQENQKWQHRYNSDIGRVNAYQKKIQELEQQVKSRPAKSDNPEPSGYSDKEWAALKEDFPEIAAAIEARSHYQEEQIQALRRQVEDSVGPIQQQAHQAFIQSQYQILESHHPDWKDVVQQNGFTNWLSMQPPSVQDLLSSDRAADAAYLLNTYKLASGVQQRQTDEISQKRQRQLRQSQTIPSRGVRKTNAVPEDDYDAAFDYYASKKAVR